MVKIHLYSIFDTQIQSIAYKGVAYRHLVEERHLSLENLEYFHAQVPFLDEVSIGHALICDALYLGIENTIQMYLNQLR